MLALCLLAAIGPLTVDLYLPALPALARDLRVGATTAQLTVTAATIGIAIGQLVMGHWSDTAGRRLPLLASTAVHIAASVVVALAPSIEVALGGRFLQGLGSAGGAVVATAMVRDLFDGLPFVRVMAKIALVGGLSPVAAPFLGAQLMHWADWRGLFGVVACYGALAVVVAAITLRETLPRERRLSIRWPALASRYREIFTDRVYVGVAIVGGLMVSGVFATITTGAFLLQGRYGLSPDGYALVVGLYAIAFAFGTQASARVIRRFGPGTVLTAAVPTMAAAGFAIAPAAAIAGLAGLAAATSVFMLAAGATGPCSGVLALQRHGRHAGTAAAVLGAANFGMAGLASPLVGWLGVDSPVPVSLVIGAAETAALAALLLLVRPALRPAASENGDA
ncbi:MAG: multidrug effflux MFS transporter [Bifidobacteriaceae bacterium]|nr:multidrug effflux MFS transporter [Bifidobacteriaceae bacterium]